VTVNAVLKTFMKERKGRELKLGARKLQFSDKQLKIADRGDYGCLKF